mgnify:FL=1
MDNNAIDQEPLLPHGESTHTPSQSGNQCICPKPKGIVLYAIVAASIAVGLTLIIGLSVGLSKHNSKTDGLVEDQQDFDSPTHSLSLASETYPNPTEKNPVPTFPPTRTKTTIGYSPETEMPTPFVPTPSPTPDILPDWQI